MAFMSMHSIDGVTQKFPEAWQIGENPLNFDNTSISIQDIHSHVYRIDIAVELIENKAIFDEDEPNGSNYICGFVTRDENSTWNNIL